MEHLSLEKKKRIALFGTIVAGVILVGVFVLIQISKQRISENQSPRAPFKELYTTLKDTTQQYFTKEK